MKFQIAKQTSPKDRFFSLNQQTKPLKKAVWDKYHFLEKLISEYICYHSYWMILYSNIFGMIKDHKQISKYILSRKNQQIFLRMNIFVQHIQIYSNI